MRAVIESIRPVPGSARVIVTRFLLGLAAALPVMMIGGRAFGEAVATRPYLVDASRPLSLVRFARLMEEVPGAVWGTVAAGAVLTWLAGQFLTAGAVSVLAPGRARPVRLWRAVIDVGTPAIWAYLRIAAMSGVLLMLGSGAIGAVFRRLSDHGELAGWTADTTFYRVVPARILVVLTWAAVVGTLAMWARVIVVADRRRRVRRVPGLVLRVWRRHPIQGLMFHVLALTVSLFTGAAWVAYWRISGGGAGWAVPWVGAVAIQAVIWHWRLRACRVLWSDPDLADLRACPDGGPGWLRTRLARRRAASGA